MVRPEELDLYLSHPNNRVYNSLPLKSGSINEICIEEEERQHNPVETRIGGEGKSKLKSIAVFMTMHLFFWVKSFDHTKVTSALNKGSPPALPR